MSVRSAAAVERLKADLDELVQLEPTELSDVESIVALKRGLSRLQAVCAAAVVGFEGSGAWRQSGARSAVAYLAVECHDSKEEIRRQLRNGKAAGELRLLDEAWRAGAVGPAQVSLFAPLLAREPLAMAARREEEVLVGHARRLRVEELAQALQYFAQLADPDGVEGAEARRRDRRHLDLARSLDGVYFGKMLLDPISGEIVSNELSRLERQLFQSDWKTAEAELGRRPSPHELRRTPGQRRADALVEMAVRSAAMPPGARRPAPLFSVLVDFPTLTGRICELASGAVVPPGSLLPYLEGADVERAVWSLPGRVEVSAKSRLFRGATRRAIELRDRRCTHPYCDEPAARCQVDHVVPACEGGETRQEGGRLACGAHNRSRTRDGPLDPWSEGDVQWDGDGYWDEGDGSAGASGSEEPPWR